jgi:L-seryl-tRNA(Ser) seleniumtransferase
VGEHEPTPAEALRKGVDLVCFSGDKLLGGPQAGVIAGKARLVLALKRHPLFRALRCDKLRLAALQTTVDLYLDGGAGSAEWGVRNVECGMRNAERGAGSGERGVRNAAGSDFPVLEMLSLPVAALRARAEKMVAALTGLPLNASVGTGKAQVGGGTLPRAVIASVTLDLQPQGLTLAEFVDRLRAGAPPVIGYVAGGKVKLDLRTVFPTQDDLLTAAVRSAMRPG